MGRFGKRYSYSRADEGEGDYAHVHYGDIHSTYNDFIKIETKVPTIKSESKHEILANGDIIIADASEDHDDLGKTLVIEDIDNRKLIAGLHTFNFRPDKMLNPKFYLYYTQSNSYKNFIYRKATGISVLGLSKLNIENMELKLPNIDEQKILGTFFFQLDQLITLHQRKYKKLKIIQKAILNNFFHKKEENSSNTFFKKIVGAWEHRKLGEVADIVGGGTPSTSNPKYWDGEINWYAPAEINDQIYVNSSERKITEEGLNKSSARMLPIGTVLFTSRAGIGKTAILSKKGCTNQGFQSIVPHQNKLDSYFIFSRTEELKRYGEKAGAGSTFVEISGKQMAKMQLMMPKTMEEQKKISTFFSNLDSLITLHQSMYLKIKKLENIKSSLINSERGRKLIFNRETDFEEALISALKRKGWDREVLKYPNEQDLIDNWAQILFDNNGGIDRLNDAPLTDTEMDQILEQIINLRTPLKLNSFINGKTVSITRDNPNDKRHYGKEISLKIYDRQEIAAGQSRYQIAQQPIFKSKSPILSDRRGDFMLLINGMPVIHVELKKSGIPVSQAYNQIEKYAYEGVFTGIYSLVQIFVAMNPDEAVYFSNPGPDGKFNRDFYFNWADYNNEPLNNWKHIASRLLSIPMAHQLIGFYTVADDSDGVLKVMRAYQYFAANAISDKVSKIKWGEKNQRGGYIWHTTGSGKTMTSFKSAQLIANSKDAEKVIFLMDRIELGTQSLYEYRAFADDREEIQATENTGVLISKLKSKDPANTLIVTSIQKMSRIEEDDRGLNSHDIEIMNKKKIVFIIDEAHRSTFGDMMLTIKKTFPDAVFFGFTGTPIYDKNKKKDSTTATIFGDELHRYTIADGIRDGNVLGFDPYKVTTYRDKDLRKALALEKAKVDSEEEVFEDEDKKAIYFKYMNDIPMAGYENEIGQYISGIEDEIKAVQYNRDEHRQMVVDDIFENWTSLSQNGKFHALFATSSIVEAIKYYRLIKKEKPQLKVTALFDSNIDNNGNDKGQGALFKGKRSIIPWIKIYHPI